MKKSNNNLQTLKLYWGFAWKYPIYVIGLIISVPLANSTCERTGSVLKRRSVIMRT